MSALRRCFSVGPSPSVRIARAASTFTSVFRELPSGTKVTTSPMRSGGITPRVLSRPRATTAPLSAFFASPSSTLSTASCCTAGFTTSASIFTPLGLSQPVVTALLSVSRSIPWPLVGGTGVAFPCSKTTPPSVGCLVSAAWVASMDAVKVGPVVLTMPTSCSVKKLVIFTIGLSGGDPAARSVDTQSTCNPASVGFTVVFMSPAVTFTGSVRRVPSSFSSKARASALDIPPMGTPATVVPRGTFPFVKR